MNIHHIWIWLANTNRDRIHKLFIKTFQIKDDNLEFNENLLIISQQQTNTKENKEEKK